MKKILILISILLLFMSCQKQEMDITEGQMNIQFIHPGATKVTDSAFENGDQIGLYVVETPAPLQVSGNYINNLQATYNGTNWTGDSGLKWPSTTSTCDLYAYYPYMAVSSITAAPFSVLQDQSSGYGPCDFMWGKVAGQAYSVEAIPLVFAHKLSKVTLRLVRDLNTYEGELPSNATMYIHSTVTDATVDLTTGSITKDPFATEKTITCHKVSDDTYEAVVVPQRLSSRTPLFEMVANGVSYMVDGTFNYKPGINHTFQITLKSSTESIHIEIGGEIENWN